MDDIPQISSDMQTSQRGGFNILVAIPCISPGTVVSLGFLQPLDTKLLVPHVFLSGFREIVVHNPYYVQIFGQWDFFVFS